MGDLTAFFAMGGYAAFVWPAFGVAAIGMMALLLQSLFARRRAQAEIARLEEARAADEGAP